MIGCYGIEGVNELGGSSFESVTPDVGRFGLYGSWLIGTIDDGTNILWLNMEVSNGTLRFDTNNQVLTYA